MIKEPKENRKMAVSPRSGAAIPAGGKGRPKGSKNKISGTAKENVQRVFDLIGGIEGMRKWASKNDRNRSIFYQSLYSKILPMEHEHSGEVKTDGSLTIRVIHVKGTDIPDKDGGNGDGKK